MEGGDTWGIVVQVVGPSSFEHVFKGCPPKVGCRKALTNMSRQLGFGISTGRHIAWMSVRSCFRVCLLDDGRNELHWEVVSACWYGAMHPQPVNLDECSHGQRNGKLTTHKLSMCSRLCNSQP